MKNFRKLREEEIDVKVGSVTSKGYTLLLYKNARTDMAILDEMVGCENWQNKFYEVCGNLYCSLGINVNHDKAGKEPLWIWKDDCGVESDFGDKEKGQASDARKRAGFAWGIGRELYTSPFIFVSCETEPNGSKGYKISNYEDLRRSNSMKVAKITYDDNDKIKDLVIVDNNGEIAFTTEKTSGSNKKTNTENNSVFGGSFLLEKGKYAGKTIKQIYELDKSYLDYCLGNANVSETIKSNIRAFYHEVM